MTTRLITFAVTLGLALAASVLTATTALGQPQAPLTRWAVTAADESGPDDRASIQPELDAGQSVTEHLSVQNLGDREETFRLTAADGFTTPTGRFDMLASDEESTEAGTWIDIPDEVTVAAGESEVVPFTITVPDQAEPGDHPAGVAASVVSRQSAEDGTAVGVESRMGVKVITRVTGELSPALEIGEVSTSYHGTWNPFRPGDVTATVELSNTGNTRLAVAGRATSGTGETTLPDPAEPIGDLLPGDTRQVSLTIEDVWPTIYLPGELVLAPEGAALDGSTVTAPQARASFGLWAAPWPQLLVLLGLALIIAALIGNRRRGRRRLEALLTQAREEGRRSAGSQRRMLAPHGALAAAVLVTASLVPTAAVATGPQHDPEEVGVHVTIEERDEATSAPTETPAVRPDHEPGETPGGHLATTGTELIALLALGALLGGAGLIIRRTGSPRGESTPRS